MNENVVDILIYLYENYVDNEHPQLSSQAELHGELLLAGFPEREIDKAFRWLNELTSGQGAQYLRAHEDHTNRVFTETEARRLDLESRSLLLFLEQNGILDQVSRERVIERALALEHRCIGVNELKWIVLMVLMNIPGQEHAHAQMEDLVYSEQPFMLH